ncbi:hypothetical protein LAZ67_1004166 [Cordylochernes scorpioides]|uniref:Reverse transcriptase domain-containing protein n=1 Tax=Cordylochernes scorpioides TaxID=51811 RepID=A0ABY6JY59_9ARAC|nr:hypothetical protein LAZ67_1004166 [Cordylochernes scorpioides]
MLAADMRIKVRPGRPKSKPWYSRECYLAKKSAKASLTTFKETNTDVDRNIYVSNRKRYTTLINFNKKKYLQEKQELLKNARDSANFWKTIATLKDKSYIQGNITILEWQCFYNKLLSAETTIGSDLSTLSRIDPELYCEISITEITREISSLANEKACGADEIPNEALKTLPFEHLVTLKNIFNRIINSGSYPLIWSKSIIHPIFKSGDRDNPSNYRGIALISNLSKLFTSILKSRLRNWIEGRSIIPENQAGFRKGYSCQDHIFTLLSLIQLTLRRKRRKLYAFFVDLKKAFDTVPHSLLWSKLGELGLDFRFVNLIRNYFEQMTTTHRMNIANEMLDSVRDDPNLLQRVITGDEAWVDGYDVETKAQSSQWKLPHEPRPKKARQVRSNVKVLLTVFFDCRGVVHDAFLPQGITVNKEYYLQVMRNLREAIRQKRPDLWKNKIWLLHHDNAPAHTSLLVRDFLAKNNTLMMPQPPYSPDLAPCDFFLFPKLKRPMKGRRYATLDEIKTASEEELKKILKNDFLKCFED